MGASIVDINYHHYLRTTPTSNGGNRSDSGGHGERGGRGEMGAAGKPGESRRETEGRVPVGVSIVMGTPKMDDLEGTIQLKWDDLGVPLLQETSIWDRSQMALLGGKMIIN